MALTGGKPIHPQNYTKKWAKRKNSVAFSSATESFPAYLRDVYFDLTSLYAWTVAIVLVSVLFEKAVLLAVRLLYGRLERL